MVKLGNQSNGMCPEWAVLVALGENDMETACIITGNKLKFTFIID
ncbi:MAG: hypothetical protein Q4B50_08690 [Bacillota bacterium]|nr:hypothetical protein [Bacillota bacterium]